VVVDKLYNILGQDYPADRLEVLVGDDGSNDQTARLVDPFVGKNVFMWRSPVRLGKATMINRLLERATGELLLMTDASCTLGDNALKKMVLTMTDPRVGAAVPTYSVGGDSAEARIWSLWKRARPALMRLGIFMGACGGAFMIRRKGTRPLAADTINDDYTLAWRATASGRWLWPVTTARVQDRSTSTRGSWHRMTRIAAGDAQMMMRLLKIPAPAGHRLGLLFHKGMRLSIPLMVLAAVAGLSWGSLKGFWLASFALALCGGAFVVGLLAMAATFAQMRMDALSKVIGHFTLMFLAQPVGLVRALKGQQTALWRRPDGNRGLAFAQPLRVQAAKRILDFSLAFVGIILTAPLMAIVAVLVRLDSKGPSLFGQKRVCKWEDGTMEEFVMYKFRSMKRDAEAASGPTWATAHDPRVTSFGRFLRKSRLDELPQLFNVLLGQMSLVGPRPERAYFVKKLHQEIPGYEIRVKGIKPGITGWAQVHCGYDTDVEAVRNKILFDLAYAAHLGSVSDYLRIEGHTLLKTVKVVLGGRNAH
jgi:lipopolysaccharide/colanic/teichoic acid biosynthesis glycosyltransferase